MSNKDKINKIADWLEKQVSDSSITDGTIWNKMKLSKTTFYRLKPKAIELFQDRSNKRQKIVESVTISETIEAAKSGLKSKTERVLILQNEIDNCLKELYDADTPNYAFQGGSLKQVGKMLTVMERTALRNTIRSLQSEISKIEGDYAPDKIDHTTKGKSMNGEVDVSKLPTEVIDAIIAAEIKKKHDQE